MRFDIQIKGLDRLFAKLEHGKQTRPQAVAAALYQEAETIMAAAKEITPLDTGALRNSGHVQLPVITPQQVTVRMGFGGAAASYAIYVHENLTARHPVGQAKYLEVPVNRARKGLAKRIAERAHKLQVG